MYTVPMKEGGRTPALRRGLGSSATLYLCPTLVHAMHNAVVAVYVPDEVNNAQRGVHVKLTLLTMWWWQYKTRQHGLENTHMCTCVCSPSPCCRVLLSQ